MTPRHAAPAPPDRWDRSQHAVLSVSDLLCLDTTESPIPGATITWEPHLAAMAALESGEVANPDEGRRVGHYWLRAPEQAPSDSLRADIESTIVQTREISTRILASLQPQFVLHLGIGGSALGPELLRDALGGSAENGAIQAAHYHVLDNVDPDGLANHLARVDLSRTLVVVVSKSGGTAEVRQGLRVIADAFKGAGLVLAAHAVAITGRDSLLDRKAQEEQWLARLPIWDFVGGRTSVTSPVGLFPLALLGGDLDAFLDGAAAMDVETRRSPSTNPAIWLAERWFEAQADQPRAMVVLPYADRLASLSRYLQQLVMESLGKRLDRSGGETRAALTVYGNKGSTDQHAYIQQLRDGPDDFFAVFVEVVQTTAATGQAGDLLYSLLDGTRSALYNDGKSCITVQLPHLNARTLGALIALFERAVGLYAEVLNINAYHQPGVEAGKQAAAATLEAQRLLLDALSDLPLTTEAICRIAGLDDALTAWRLLCRLAHQGRGVERQRGDTPRNDQFFLRRAPGGDISSNAT